MRHDDRHVREINCHIVDRHRVSVLQPDPAAAAHPGADAAMAGVKQHRQFRLGEHFVQRIRDAIVRRKLLNRRGGVSPPGGPPPPPTPPPPPPPPPPPGGGGCRPRGEG